MVVAFVVSFVVMAASASVATAASYFQYEREAADKLSAQADSYAELLAELSQEEMVDALGDIFFPNMHCMLADANGNTIFDSAETTSSMENRVKKKEGEKDHDLPPFDQVNRRSASLDDDVLFVLAPVRDGITLYLSETRTSLLWYLGGIAVPLALSLIAVVALSYLVSLLLVNMIVRPLKDVDLSRPLENDAYEEIQPLLQRIDLQRRELQLQNEQLEQAVEARREFAGNVSHEMKTPLQVIGGYAELIEGGTADAEDVPRFAGLIRNEAETMRTLIDDVLTLSKLDEGGGSAEGPANVAAACKKAVGRLESEINERDVSLELTLDESAQVKGDSFLVEQAVYNLVDNAIRHNGPGVAVEVSVEMAEGEVVLTVGDDGQGIPEENRPRIFERFYRVDPSHSRETGGTGLGLAIVEHFAELLGGSVAVGDSHLGGAEFKMVLPAAPEE